MKFLIDAQLPKSLARYLREQGHDAIHTLELPRKNATDDAEICQISVREQRVVISKDVDFYDSYQQRQEPFKLVYLTVGNLSNAELNALFEKNLNHLMALMEYSAVIEMNRYFVITLL